ncbi:MAG: hypothetical protein GKR90_24575 [Pseudomonadales bacterium]|nr:hypothetical protein [Pseudomonadales bacterium]
MHFTTETRETRHPVRVQNMADIELHHPDRGIELDTAENVRDLGGYTTRDGGKTRWRVFVRSGDMDALSTTDQQTFVNYGISTVIDLRMQKEIDVSPNAFTDSDAVVFKIHDFWGTRFDAYRSANKQAPPPQKLADLYCAGLEKSGFVMAEIMATFAADERTGYAFHCRSGKDRTGLVAALLLSIAEVSRDTICKDYGLTAEYLKQGAINPIEANKPGAWQCGCEAETMALTLTFLDERFGGPIKYLQAQGVSDDNLDTIRAKFVTNPSND